MSPADWLIMSHLANRALQSCQVLPQGCPRSKHRCRRSLQHWIAVCGFANAMFIAAPRDGTNLEPEVPQEPTHRHFQSDHALLDGLSGPAHGTDFLRRDGFTMNRPEPTEMKKPCNALGIPAIRLDWHALQGTFHLSCFHQDDIQPGICQPTMQPLRQGTGL